MTTRSVNSKSPNFSAEFKKRETKIYECDKIEHLQFVILRVRNRRISREINPVNHWICVAWQSLPSSRALRQFYEAKICGNSESEWVWVAIMQNNLVNRIWKHASKSIWLRTIIVHCDDDDDDDYYTMQSIIEQLCCGGMNAISRWLQFSSIRFGVYVLVRCARK